MNDSGSVYDSARKKSSGHDRAEDVQSRAELTQTAWWVHVCDRTATAFQSGTALGTQTRPVWDWRTAEKRPVVETTVCLVCSPPVPDRSCLDIAHAKYWS